MDKIVCRLVELPSRVNAVTVVDENGDYNVYVNALLPPDCQRRAFDHECRHIKRKHFHSTLSVEICEQDAERMRSPERSQESPRRVPGESQESPGNPP